MQSILKGFLIIIFACPVFAESPSTLDSPEEIIYSEPVSGPTDVVSPTYPYGIDGPGPIKPIFAEASGSFNFSGGEGGWVPGASGYAGTWTSTMPPPNFPSPFSSPYAIDTHSDCESSSSSYSRWVDAEYTWIGLAAGTFVGSLNGAGALYLVHHNKIFHAEILSRISFVSLLAGLLPSLYFIAVDRPRCAQPNGVY